MFSTQSPVVRRAASHYWAQVCLKDSTHLAPVATHCPRVATDANEGTWPLADVTPAPLARRCEASAHTWC
jgi:hypothetical protein